jgi:hypothetical protein
MFWGTSEGIPSGGWIQGATPLAIAVWDAVLKVEGSKTMLEGTTKVVALSLEMGTRETGGRVFEGGAVTIGALVSTAELVVVSGTCEAVVMVETTESLVILVSETGMVGSLDGEGLLVTPVTPEFVMADVVTPVSVGAEDVVTAVSVGAEDVVTAVSVGAEDVVTAVSVGSGLEVSTPVPLADPEGVIPEVVTTSVGVEVGTSVEPERDVSDVGIEMIVSVVAVGRDVKMPVPVGSTDVAVGSERMLDTSEMMLEITLETSGRERVSLGRRVGSLEGSDVGMPVTVGAVGPIVESLTPEAVEVGSVGLRIEVTSETTEERTDDTSDTTEERSDDTPGRSSVSLTVSEVGIAPELVIVGVAIALVAPVPNAVVMPTTIPLVGKDSGIPEEELMSLDGSTTLLGIPPTEPVPVAEGVSSEPDSEVTGRIPVGEASSPVRLDKILGNTPVGEASSPVRLDRRLGNTPVGEASSPVRLDRKLDRMFWEGKDPVGTG